MDEFFAWQGDDLILHARIQPKASREKLGDVIDGRIKIYLTAPPIDGKANKALCRYLGRLFKTPPSGIEILSGQSDRNKRLRIPSPRQLPEMISAQPGT